jgi:glycosyltransferase involved in cell wall biosynthesis
MKSKSIPLVSIVTPVYNGERFLAECIESVLAQTYKKWEYIILNNCSTDDTLNIANSYAEKDNRIRVVSNKCVLPIMKNWNHALRQISSYSKYCKVVHADDLLFPRCIELMVGVANKNTSIGIVGSYGLKGNEVVSDKLTFPQNVFPGREISRLALLKHTFPFPRPTALLILSDLIRKNDTFYNEANLHADHEVCYETLRDYDFGFVHQVLTFMRTHDESVTSTDYATFGKLFYTNLDLLINYGPVFLEKNEFNETLNSHLRNYYRYLAHSLFNKKDTNFWEYHKKALQDSGYELSKTKLYRIIITELIKHPRSTFKRFCRLN